MHAIHKHHCPIMLLIPRCSPTKLSESHLYSAFEFSKRPNPKNLDPKKDSSSAVAASAAAFGSAKSAAKAGGCFGFGGFGWSGGFRRLKVRA